MTASLRVGHMVPDTEAEGPGHRFAIWVKGCPLRCPDCCNPELLPMSGGTVYSSDALVERILSTPGIEGVSFLGGEPMAQPDGVLDVARRVRRAGLSVMVFSGFTLAELRARRRAVFGQLLSEIDVLVDGPYDRARPEKTRRWIGSDNQVMHFLTDRYSPAQPVFYTGNTVEIRLTSEAVLVNGWPAAADALLSLTHPVD